MIKELIDAEKLKQERIKQEWLEKNCFRIGRLICSVILSIAIVLLVILSFKNVFFSVQINKAINDQNHTLNTWTITETITPKSDKPVDPSKYSNTEKKIEVVNSASPIVWTYGLQLTAWTGMLGMLLWTIVALCRED